MYLNPFFNARKAEGTEREDYFAEQAGRETQSAFSVSGGIGYYLGDRKAVSNVPPENAGLAPF
jgi:hypothetical protein